MIAFSRWTANLRGPVSHRCALPSKCGSGRPLRCRRCCWSRRGACCAPGRRRCAKASPSPSPPTRSRFAACCCCPAALHMHPNSASGCTLHVVCCSHAKLRSPSQLPCSSSAGRWRRFLARGSRRGPRAAATCSATASDRSAPQVRVVVRPSRAPLHAALLAPLTRLVACLACQPPHRGRAVGQRRRLLLCLLCLLCSRRAQRAGHVHRRGVPPQHHNRQPLQPRLAGESRGMCVCVQCAVLNIH